MISDRKQVSRIILLFVMVYTVSYISRINYGAIISELEQALMQPKTALSLALTGSFISYGIGQLLSGLLGDRISPKKLISLGLLVTTAINAVLPLLANAYLMAGLWCVNGLAQAFLWPPIVKLMSALFSDEDYASGSVKVAWGSSFGTIIVYLVAPLLISCLSWRAVFWFSALCAGGALLIWHFHGVDVPAVSPQKTEGPAKASFFHPVLLAVMIGIVLQGILRDGITTWMPSLIHETYHLGTSVSILTGVILPVFSILCFRLAAGIHKKITNPVTCAGLLFGLGSVGACLLWLTSGQSAILSVLCSALLTGCMHGVNLMLICMIPPFFRKTGRVSTVSGLLNSCTYVGSAASSYGIALLSESYDWSITLLVWLAVALLGTLFCLLAARPWASFSNKNVSDE